MGATDASPFTAPIETDLVPSVKEPVDNAYVQALYYSSLVRSALDDTGTDRPKYLLSSDNGTFDTAKAALLTALDTVVLQTKNIVDLLNKARPR